MSRVVFGFHLYNRERQKMNLSEDLRYTQGVPHPRGGL